MSWDWSEPCPAVPGKGSVSIDPLSMTGEAAARPHVAEAAGSKAQADLFIRCQRALEALLTNRGNPSCDVDWVLTHDPRFVFGHCLRAALIVRADDAAARSKLVASVTAIEESCLDITNPARRHAFAARAWLDGDKAQPLYYDAILIDEPRDILALAVGHALDFHLGRRGCASGSPRCCRSGQPTCRATPVCSHSTLSPSKKPASIDVPKKWLAAR